MSAETAAVEVVTKRATPWRMVMVMGGAGVTHFTNPGFYEEIVPKWAPGSKDMWVKASGVAELACAALMISPKTRRLGGWLTTATLFSVWTANIQLALCTPNFLILEGIGRWDGIHADLLKDPVRWEDGYVIPPTAPGLGIELDEAVALAHPYVGTQLHLEPLPGEAPMRPDSP